MGKATTKPTNKEEDKVFNNPVAKTGIQDKPITNDNNPDAVEMTQIPTVAFQEILERLNQLETKEGAIAKEDDEIFDPLAHVKGDSIARVSYMYNTETGENDLVLAYIPRTMANGQEKDTWIAKEKTTGELRTYCSVKVMNSKGEINELKDIDYISFLEGIETKNCPIKKRTDIGRSVKQDTVIQRLWNGKTLAPTNTRVQTGYLEQKFQYEIEVDGKVMTFNQNVINIK